MTDPIEKVKSPEELTDLLENEKAEEEYNRLMRIPQDGSPQANYAKAKLVGCYGEGDIVFGEDQGVARGEGVD